MFNEFLGLFDDSNRWYLTKNYLPLPGNARTLVVGTCSHMDFRLQMYHALSEC
jgi:hypothetical protein